MKTMQRIIFAVSVDLALLVEERPAVRVDRLDEAREVHQGGDDIIGMAGMDDIQGV